MFDNTLLNDLCMYLAFCIALVNLAKLSFENKNVNTYLAIITSIITLVLVFSYVTHKQ